MPTTNVMDRLREETREHHARAEHHAFQKALLGGRLSREQFGRWLEQMRFVHLELERLIDAARARVPALSVVRDLHRHSERLNADLRALAAGPVATAPGPGATRLIHSLRDLAANSPLDLLGSQYVLEGSMNGNKYIAMSVRRSLGLRPGEGDTYLDPYGDRQREVWTAFKADMSELPLTDAQIDRIVEAAKAMFEGVGWISEDLMPSAEPAAV